MNQQCVQTQTRSNRPCLFLPRNSRNVLIVMVERHLGNFVVSLPVIETLLAYFDQRPTVVVDERFVSLVRMLPSAGEVLAYPKQVPKRRGVLRNFEPISFMAKLATGRFRTVIDLSKGQRGAFLSFFTSAKQRIGFQSKFKYSWLYSHQISAASEGHARCRYPKLLAVIGTDETPQWVRLTPPQSARDEVAAQLNALQPNPQLPFAVIHPGSGEQWRNWPCERFAAVADAIIQRHQLNVCIIGTAAEKKMINRLHCHMREKDAAFSMSLNINQLVSLFERACVIISNESGPTHLAAATDVPIVTIFGPGDESRWRPVREDNIILLRGALCDPRCSRKRCVAENRCLTELQPDTVIQAVDQVLRTAPKAVSHLKGVVQ